MSCKDTCFHSWMVIRDLRTWSVVMYQTDGAGEIRRNSFICSEARMDRQPALAKDFLLSGTQFCDDLT